MEEQTRLKDVGVGLSGKPVDGTPVGSGRNGLLHVASVEEIKKAQKDNEEAKAKAVEDDRPQLKALENYLASVYEDCRRFKEDETEIQSTMIDSLNRRNAKYDEEKISKIKEANSSDAFIGLTGVKCRAFESWVHDIYTNAKRKRTWDLKPTPIADIPPDETEKIVAAVMQVYNEAGQQGEQMTPQDTFEIASRMRAEIISRTYSKALEKAENMSRKIHDQLIEGGWVKAFSQATMDISTMKAGIIKGPVIRKRKVRSGWEQGENGIMSPKITSEVIPTFERVSPLDFYPGRTNESVNDGPVCEKLYISRESLVSNREEPGYNKANIEHIAMNSPSIPAAGTSTLQSERDAAERRDHHAPAPSTGTSIQAIEIWCRCPGRDLPEFGITKDLDGKKIDPLLDYDINAITVNGRIVYLSLNEDELGRRPYSVSGYSKEIGGFWYMGIPELLKNEQDITNAAARNLVNNLGIASGPQVMIPDINRIPSGQNITSMYPWKIWQGSNPGGLTSPLVDFFQPDSRSAELSNVMSMAIRMSDQTIEMPSYAYGNDKVAGAGRTASGLSMLMGSSNRGLKRVLLNMDRDIFQTVVERMYDWNMKNIPDSSIKGDMNFVSEGIVTMIMREQLSEKRLGLLQATQNEFDMKILGLDGRAKILRDAIESLEADYDDIKPSEEKIRALIQQESILQQQKIQENQINIEKERAIIEREAQVAADEVEIKRQKLIIEAEKMRMEDSVKNRELDIRASKQGQDLLGKMYEKDMEADEEAEPEAE
jgi:hypothetical protein